MSKPVQLVLTLLIDAVALNAAFLVYYKFREQISVFAFSEYAPMAVPAMLLLCLLWLLIFWLFGLYRAWHIGSRYDEVVVIFQAVTFGAVMLFVLIFADDMSFEASTGIERPYSMRFAIVIYWGMLFLLAAAGRLILRGVLRRQVLQGFGRRNAVIIGTDARAKKLSDDIARYAAMGMDVRGFVSANGTGKAMSHNGLPTLGHTSNLIKILEAHKIDEVLIAVNTEHHDELMQIIGQCESRGVGMKVLPDMYDIFSGAARLSHIYGIALVDIGPQPLSPLAENLKRLFDIALSLAVLIIGLPVWLVIMFVVWIDTRASPIYRQTRVGKGGSHFTIYKFRSMRADAESSGPQLTQKNDARVTKFGGFMRKVRLDEFPQFFNVLKGEMSVVGPRPERPHFIDQIVRHAPHYTRLHRVRPGITSWGQVKYGYAQNTEEMLERLKYDLFYIENMSLRLDFKILFATIYVVFTGRGQ
ncbi:MAG: sugar transferase [Rhizobacter sp.]|nr:sugar transferase [Chlorobiales bacterium]